MLTEEHMGRDWSVAEVVEKVLAYYFAKCVQFPPKTTMDRIVHRYLWHIGRREDVAAYYLKNLSF